MTAVFCSRVHQPWDYLICLQGKHAFSYNTTYLLSSDVDPSSWCHYLSHPFTLALLLIEFEFSSDDDDHINSIMGMCSSIATTFNTPLLLGGPASVV